MAAASRVGPASIGHWSLGTGGCTVVTSERAGRIRCGRFVGARRVEVVAVSRRVQTLLFTDIVGSTDRLRELGDAAWARLLARYHHVVRAALAVHGGREVDTAGDGVLARFETPASAVRAAVAARAAVAPLRIEVRAGLHTGEVEVDGDAVTGVGVHLAARVMGQAGPGQVLVSATVRELMAGSGLGFVDLGVRELKGLPRAGGCSAFGSCLSVAGAASRLWQRRWRPGQGFASACSLKICCPR